MSVLEIAKSLNKKYNDDKLAIQADVVPEYTRMATGAFGLDFPLYGGLVRGRIHTFSGLYHSGKTLATCVCMAAYQRLEPEKICVYVDMEHSLDLQFQSRMTGLDTSKMVYFNPTTLTGEEVLDAILDFQKEDDIGMIVLDSIPALLPAQAVEKDMTSDPGMRGTIAKPMHRFLIAMSSLVNKTNNIFIMINQVRVSGTTFTGAPIYTEPGGQAPAYYSSIKVRFGTRTFIKGDKVDCSEGEGADGFRLKFSITKNKCGSIARGGGFISFNYEKGLMWLDDLMEIAKKFDFIKSSGAYCTLINLKTGEVYTDENGKPLKDYLKNLKNYILNNIDFQKEYLNMLTEYICKSSETYGDLLDERDKKEITAQEESVELALNQSIEKKETK